MRIALLSDIHGNIRALASVLADADRCCADAFVSLGDMVFMGLDPQPCFDAVMARSPVIRIKGNTDANLEEVSTFVPSNPFEEQLLDLIADCDAKLSAEAKRTIAGWPIASLYRWEDTEMICCHGSPYSFSEKLLPGNGTGEALQKKLRNESAGLICCGHTHRAGDFVIAGKRIINPGAVGYAFDGDTKASYAIIDQENGAIRCEIRKISYDAEGYKKELAGQCERFPLLRSVLYALEHGLPMPNFR